MLHIINIMKISFIGKGGSGKSTFSSLFALFLTNKKYQVALMDADINIHIPKIFNVKFNEKKFLSNFENALDIRKYLAGSNKRIDYKKMVKTTPPGNGSNFFYIDRSNFVLKKFSEKIKDDFYLLVVGTYKGEKAGLSCYHTDLSIFENILSHSNFKKNQFLISDMVAGVDSLANSLFLQFNLHFFILEPTKESVEVYNSYKKELKKTDFKVNIIPIFNKLESQEDLYFLIKKTKETNYIKIPKIKILKLLSQGKIKIEEIIENKNINLYLNQIFRKLNDIKIDKNKDLNNLKKLHLRYCQLDYVKRAYGNLENQIDNNFSF